MLDLVTFVLLNIRSTESDSIVINFALRSMETLAQVTLDEMLRSLVLLGDAYTLEITSIGNEGRMIFGLICNPQYADRFLAKLITNSELIHEKHPRDLKKSEINRAKVLWEILHYICPELDNQHRNDE